MCLSWPPIDYDGIANAQQTASALEAARKKLASHGKNVSCDNTLVYVARTERGGVAVIQSIPVLGTSTVVFPINPEHKIKLKACETLECQASNMHAIMNPSLFVEYIEEVHYTGPVYRSLGNASTDEDVQISRPHVNIKPLEVFHNPDGGAVAMIPVAEHITRNITVEDRARLGAPMLSCIVDGLAASGIDPCRVFGDEYDPDDQMTTFDFLSFLFDAVTPDCDIVIGIMPEGKKEGRFTFCYYDEDDLGSVPIVGLVHGDLRPMQRVEDTIFIATNDPCIEVMLSKDLPYSGENEKRLGSNVTIIPQPSDVFIKDHYVEREIRDPSIEPIPYPFGFDESLNLPSYRGTRGEHTHGNHVWANAQKEFQAPLIGSVNGIIDNFLFKTIGEYMNTTDIFCASNIKGMKIPRNSVEATIMINARMANTPAAIARNMAILKRINDGDRDDAKKFKGSHTYDTSDITHSLTTRLNLFALSQP
jgi:hypothetical protein